MSLYYQGCIVYCQNVYCPWIQISIVLPRKCPSLAPTATIPLRAYKHAQNAYRMLRCSSRQIESNGKQRDKRLPPLSIRIRALNFLFPCPSFSSAHRSLANSLPHCQVKSLVICLGEFSVIAYVRIRFGSFRHSLIFLHVSQYEVFRQHHLWRPRFVAAVGCATG